jgi:hypothetical protein
MGLKAFRNGCGKAEDSFLQLLRNSQFVSTTSIVARFVLPLAITIVLPK